MAKYHKIRISFFDKRVRSFMSRTAITLKFKLRWFPDYSAEKVYTDINLPPLMSNEDKYWWLFNFEFKKVMTSRASQHRFLFHFTEFHI